MKRTWSRWQPAIKSIICNGTLCFVACLVVGCAIGARRAPELIGTRPINCSVPVALSKLRGKIVVLDFWSYSCVNCLKTVEPLKEMEAKFKKDVVFIGVHSPKYDPEKPDQCVRAAVRRYGIDSLVINDPEITAWNNYGVISWPTFVVVDPRGNIAHQFTGDKSLLSLESALVALARKERAAGAIKDGIAIQPDRPQPVEGLFLGMPAKICADHTTDRLFVSSTGSNQIIVIASPSQHPRLEAVIGNGSACLHDGSFTSSSFNHPQGLCVSGDNIYVADAGNHAIRLIDMKHQAVSTVAGDGTCRNTRVETQLPLEHAMLDSPWDVVALGDKLYIAMAGAHQIWCLDFKTNKMIRIAGDGTEDLKDGIGTSASLAQPSGICTDGSSLFFVDSEGNALRKLNPDTGEVTTLVGKAMNIRGDKDGRSNEALLQHPEGLSVSNGKIFIADSFNQKIKVFELSTGVVSTLSGSGASGKEDGVFASFNEPSAVAIMRDKLFIADTNNDAVRVLDLAQLNTSTLDLKGKQHGQ